MFYYRRKIILALLQKFNGELLSTPLQKYLFLLTRLQKEKAFDFIPYKYGCYSLQANQDLMVLEKMGYIIREQNKNAISLKLISKDDFLGAVIAKLPPFIEFVCTSMTFISHCSSIFLITLKE